MNAYFSDKLKNIKKELNKYNNNLYLYLFNISHNN